MKKILFAFLTVSIAFLASCNKKNEPENSDAPQNDETSGTVKDICGNTYNYVKIGDQYWTAENMRCNKYDTESERAGATIPTSSSYTFTPYYTDATDMSLWDSDSQKNGAELTSAQIDKLGYLYNWAAAVGVATNQTSGFNGNRQGICPNGWHVPTIEEWDVLGVALGEVEVEDDMYDWFPNVGKLLKSTSGWYKNGNGTDEHSFAALPAGFADGSIVKYVGHYFDFWTDTPYDNESAYACGLNYDSNNLFCGYGTSGLARSVRCVKNDSSVNNSSSNNNPSSNEGMKAVSGLDASKLDNTIETCWHSICKATITGITSYAEIYLWGTEREVVLSMQNSENLSNGTAKYTYEAASKDDGSCLDANNETTVSTNPLEATILRNKTYTGDFYIDDEKDDVITITFTKVSDGTLEFKATLASDEPVNGPGDVFLVGTWRLDGDLLSLYITAIYGNTSTKSTGSGRVENDGNKFNITADRTAFKNMVKK